MKNKVIVQFPIGKDTDLDRLFQIEATLHQAFTQNRYAVVDGNDIGGGKFNIYINLRASSWEAVLERVEAFLKLRGAFDEAVIAKFYGRREQYEVIWPKAFVGEFSVM